MWKHSHRKPMIQVFQARRSEQGARQSGMKRAGRRLFIEPLEDRTLLDGGLLQPISPLNAPLSPSDSAGGVSQIKNSADGRYVVYTSSAPNLVANQINQSVATNIFLYESVLQTTTLVSHHAGNPTETANGSSAYARISGDGRYVAFRSTATDLVAGQTGPPTEGNVFLYDVSTGNISLVSHRFDNPTISANDSSSTQLTTGFGFNFTNDRYLIYDSYATDLVQNQNGPGHSNLFRYDTQTGQNILISHAYSAGPSSEASGNDDTLAADISQDGSSIVFSSLAINLVSGQSPGPGHLQNDLFLWTSSSGGTIQLVSGVYDPSTGKNSPTVAAGLGNFVVSAISADANTITFISASTDLVANQQATTTPPAANVFTYYTYLGKTYLDSGVVDSTGQPSFSMMSNGDARAVAVSGDASSSNFTVAFIINSSNILPNQGGMTGNVFLFQPFINTVTLASSIAGSGGLQGAGSVLVNEESDMTDLSISADGRFVTYQSAATNIVPGQQTSASAPIMNVFLYDHNNGTNTIVSHVFGQPTINGNNNSVGSRLSFDGTSVAFLSQSSNLVSNITINSSGSDLYVYQVGNAESVLLSSRSAFPANATSIAYGSSADGRFTVFTSNSPNVVPGQIDYNRDQDVFVFDSILGTTTLVSHLPTDPLMTGDFGSPDSDTGVLEPGAPVVISGDGNWIVFVSRARNLVPGQHNPTPYIDNAFVDNLFLYDNRPGPTHGTITLISHSGGPPNDPTADSTIGDASSFNPVISYNGRYIAFVSYAQSLIAGPSILQNDTFQNVIYRANVFLYDRVKDTISILSNFGNMPSTSDSGNPTISDDGRYIAFQSRANNLIPGDNIFQNNNDYVFDQFALGGSTTLVSHIVGSPTISPSVTSFNPLISADGNYLAFVSFATNLVPGQNGTADMTNVFQYNRQTGVITLVSGADGSATGAANDYSDSPVMNDDGTFVAFRSTATNFVLGQSGSAGSNVFLFSRQPGTASLTLVSHVAGAPTTTAAGDSTSPAIDGDGGLVAYLSTANNLVTGQRGGVNGGGVNNVFGWARQLNTNFLISGQDGSLTMISSFPTFLPIVSRDPIVVFNVSGILIGNSQGTVNAIANKLLDVSLNAASFSAGPDGSLPAGTQVGKLQTVSGLLSQVVRPTYTLPTGSMYPPDNALFTTGNVQIDGSVELIKNNIPVNLSSRSSFTIMVVDTIAQFSINAMYVFSVSPASTLVAVSSTSLTSVYGQPVTFTATVTSQGNPVANTGMVTFELDGNTVGNPMPVGARGQAILTMSSSNPLTAGRHTLIAIYSGTGLYGPSTSTTLTQTVAKASTITTLSSSANPSVTGQSIVFTAALGVQSPGTGTPAGMIQFVLGSYTYNAMITNGMATFTNGFAAGTTAVSATYLGDANFSSSNGTLAGGQTVQQAKTSTAVTSSTNPSLTGQSVTFTATVSVQSPGTTNGGLNPTGMVQFVIGSYTHDAKVTSGTATFTTGFAAGTTAVSATYLGDANFSSSSTLLTQTVGKASTSTAVTSSANQSVTGQSVTFTATVEVQSPGSTNGGLNPTGSVQFMIDGSKIGAAHARHYDSGGDDGYLHHRFHSYHAYCQCHLPRG